MDVNKIKWCCSKKDGIRLIEENEKIGKEYLNNADLDFKDIKRISSRWKNIVSYYSCYNAFYAVLQKIGIRCEIHDCTLELLSFFKGLSNEQITLIKELKNTRIGVQYYLQKPKKVEEKAIADFILTCKQIFYTLSKDEIEDIRGKISQIISGKTDEKNN